MADFRSRFQQFKNFFKRKSGRHVDYSPCQFETDKQWLDLRFHSNDHIIKPDELENEINNPPDSVDETILNKIQGSLIGLALGDALGAHVEFRPHEYLVANPVEDLQGGGTWGLKRGQFTDDTSMALCLANSLVARRGFVPYDQLVRYKWWYQYGYMSSTGQCFDIGAATRQSLETFIRRQQQFAKKEKIHVKKLDYLSDRCLLEKFRVECSMTGVAGNGALMRLAPVPLFFYEHPEEATKFSGYSGQITHGDRKAYDACRYFGALIVGALNNYTKEELLAEDFYEKNKLWFGYTPLCNEIKAIAEGSYQKESGYVDGIRGKGYIVNALEAALWAFWSDENSFEKGVLAAVNLGDDTDTTAAIYGQLAGAYYGYTKLPEKWVDQVYAKKFILQLSKWIAYEGKNWQKTEVILPSKQASLGTACANSAENVLADTSTKLPHRSFRTRLSSETFPPSREKPKEVDMVSPTTYSPSSPASAQNSSSNKDKMSDQQASSRPQDNNTNNSNTVQEMPQNNG